jgi:hypothetical protein
MPSSIRRRSGFAHAAAERLVLLVDRARFVEQGRETRLTTAALGDAAHRPGEIDSSGARSDEPVADLGERLGEALARGAHADHDSVAGRDADRRSAAHGQATDRVDHAVKLGEFENDALVGEAGLVDQEQHAAVGIAGPGDGRDRVSACGRHRDQRAGRAAVRRRSMSR